MIRANLRAPGSVEEFREYVLLKESLGNPSLALERNLPEEHRERLMEAEKRFSSRNLC
jgi:hypothetical protein